MLASDNLAPQPSLAVAPLPAPAHYPFLDALRKKNIEFFQLSMQDVRYLNAALIANRLYLGLKAAADKYFASDRNQTAHDQFVLQTKEAIKLARPELEHHRGYKEILGNILLGIALLGIGYVIAGAINYALNKRFTFFRTDTAQKLDTLEKEIATISARA